MDVSCPQCAAAYAVDMTRVPPEGIAIQCSTCGHAFDVAAPASKEWRIRQPSGQISAFNEMTTLQRWIIEQKVKRDDEISKDGVAWQRLGDIVELASFFDIVDRAHKPVVTPVVRSKESPTQAHTHELPWKESGLPLPAEPAMPHSATASANPLSDTDDYEHFFEAEHGNPTPLDDFDDFDIKPPKRTGAWLVLLVLVLTGAAGTTFVLQPPWLTAYLSPQPPQTAIAVFEQAETLRIRDDLASIERAMGSYKEAIATFSDYSDAHAGLAEAYLARAAHLRWAGNSAWRSDVDQGFDHAKQAMNHDAAHARAHRAMAEYYRLMDDSEGMQRALAKADVERDQPDAVVALVRGAAIAPQAERHAEAMQHLQRALELNPQLQRARYIAARTAHGSGDDETALTLVEALLDDVPEHEAAKKLKEELVSAVADDDEVTSDDDAAEPKAGANTSSFARLLKKAQRARRSDHARIAIRYFDQALELNPNDPDALAGLGWAYIEDDRPEAAIRTFKRIIVRLPRYSDAHLGLAEAYSLKNMKRDAIKHYRAYLDILPDGAESSVVKRRLSELQGGG